ncbi:MAG: efflux RND transporter periplasmic adaptor subunit [Steroidobacteraceae bacterium]
MKAPYVLIAAALLTACSQQANNAAPRSVEVGVVTLKSEPVALQTELAGRTTAALTSDVRPQVAGIVRSRSFAEGAEVKAGQLLFQIDDAAYRAAYEEAKAALANAEAAVAAAQLKDQRYGELLAIDGVSKQDADDAHTSYQQALASVAEKKAALTSAQINLDYTQVKAPISGRIGKSSVTPGALVTASQTDALATIRTLDPMYVDLTQSSAAMLKLRRQLQAGALKSGSTVVSLKLEDGSEYPRKGKLQFSEVAVDEATGSVTLRAIFPNPDGTLLPGMYVRAELDEAIDNDAILAPQAGISHDTRGNATALVVTADNKVEQREVTTERAIDDKWLVSSGLASGDRLLVQGSNKVKNGDTVRAVDLAASNAATGNASEAATHVASGANGTQSTARDR